MTQVWLFERVPRARTCAPNKLAGSMRFTLHVRRVLLALQAAVRLPVCGGALTGPVCVSRMNVGTFLF